MKGVTLLEVLVAISLIGVIVVGFLSIYVFSYSHFQSAGRWLSLQNELTYIIEDISREVSRATGDRSTTYPAIAVNTTTITVRVDTNSTPNNCSDDTTITYQHHLDNLDNNRWRITKNNIPLTTRGIIPQGGFVPTMLENNSGLQLHLKGRYNPGQSVSVDNPELEMRTKIYTHAVSTN